MSEEIKTGTELGLQAANEYPFMSLLVEKLERIARAQEGMLAIAAEARQERLKLAAKMQEALKRPVQEKP